MRRLAAIIVFVLTLLVPSFALANHVGDVAMSNHGSVQGITDRAVTGQLSKVTHDDVITPGGRH
ncbi:MAG: hypothetical protein IRZ18_02555 [Clostridia bacterium]|nr:hypothetical protein [Clostridia bacterium]